MSDPYIDDLLRCHHYPQMKRGQFSLFHKPQYNMHMGHVADFDCWMTLLWYVDKEFPGQDVELIPFPATLGDDDG